MADGRKSISTRSRSQSSRIGNNVSNTGVVSHIILNESDTRIPVIQNSETNPKPVDSYIGYAQVRKHTDTSSSKSSAEFYAPLDLSQGLPLVGETVSFLSLGNTNYYVRLTDRDINRGNARESKDKNLFPNEENDSSSNVKDYKEVSQTGIASSSPNGSENESKLGEYFEPRDIHQLRLYEGDKLIQSRFGQSIRFSGYNNEDKEFSPTILIRNYESDENSSELEKNELTEEDVNKDGTIIAITSKKYNILFESPLDTNPINATIPELIDYNQFFLNTERIILSSKTQEMLFFSKGDYGFISDGKFTIDNGSGGADLDFGDDVNITTDRNDGDFSVNTGNGSIYLNTDTKEQPLVRGEVLFELLDELIGEMLKMTYATPSGPTATGPLENNKQVLRDIKSRLKDFQSTKNFTE